MAKKILILNGSAKKEKSTTMDVTRAFVKGMTSDGDYTAETVNVTDLDIKPCMGCLSCCSKSQGECIINGDDVKSVRDKIEDSDVVIMSFPLYFFGLPGKLKMLVDRLLGMLNEYRGQDPDDVTGSLHGFRHPKEGQKLILISGCAWTDTDTVYESIVKQFDMICGKGNYDTIWCPQLKTLSNQGMRPRFVRYLANFEAAGKEYGQTLKISEETRSKISRLAYSESVYKELLASYWDQEREDGKKLGY